MKAAEKASKGGEISMSEKQSANGGEVIVEVQNVGKYEGKGSPSTKQSKVNLRVSTESSSTGFPNKPDSGGCPSPDVSRASPNPSKCPSSSARNESIIRRKSFNRSVISKTKSRFGEPSPVILNEDGSSDHVSSPYMGVSFSRASPNNISGVRAISISSNRNASPGRTKDKHGKMNKIILIESIVFLCILGCLVASLTAEKLEHFMVWGLEIWKWCVLVMVISCGLLITSWVMDFILFLIQRNLWLRNKVLYFVHGMKKSIQVFMWWSLVLLTWLLLFRRGLETSTKILAYVTRSIVSGLIGSFLWLLKTLLVKILASKFEAVTYFDRLQESTYHQWVLRTLSGHPLMEEADGDFGRFPRAGWNPNAVYSKTNVSHWTMKELVDEVTSSGLSTISHTLDEMEGLSEQRHKEITRKMEAAEAAYDIFLNVAPLGANYIEEWDLLRFMTEDEVELLWPQIDAAKSGQVDRKTLTDWVVKAYTSREALAHALSDTKAVVAQVDNLVSCVMIIVIIVVSLLVVEVATTSFFVFLSSQLVLAAFAFGNTCKNVFESIIFLFVTHPFDVADRVVFDGIPMIVEEMNIFSTVFLKPNNEKVYYPNSELATKSISNYYRSPDMRDIVGFSIALTPVEKIVKLKEKIKDYIEGKPQYWHPIHNVAVIDIEDVNKLKMAVYCQHTMNFQDFDRINLQRAELNFELLKILEDLNITLLSAVLPKS
ncbi:hypothetical protein ABKV19_019888 [Rosa sericea]